ncbi:MAG: OmpA family protein [Myxococcota bacterium]
MPDIHIPTRENPYDHLPPLPSKGPWVLCALLALGIGGGSLVAAELLAQEEARTQEARAAEQDAEERLLSAEAEKRALQDANETLSQKVKEREAEIAKLRETYDTLQDKLKEEIRHGDIRLTQNGERIQVDLVDKILFDSGQAELTRRGQEVLLRLGAVLAKVENRQLQVSGHTDDAPPTDKLKDRFPSNWELSTARAVTVVRFLHEQADIPGRRLVASGHGQFQPVGNNANAEGRARNRRIEILLTPIMDPKQTPVARQLASAAPRRK